MRFPKPDIAYIPTPHELVEAMLSLAKVTQDDIVYDLGCGDGRVAIAAAARRGAKGVGIDIDSQRIREANRKAKEVGVSAKVEFRQQNLFESDFSEATVVFLYLLPHLNLKLRPALVHQLQPGTRVVSRDFDMGEWAPHRVVRILAPEESTLYSWIFPQEMPQYLCGKLK